MLLVYIYIKFNDSLKGFFFFSPFFLLLLLFLDGNRGVVSFVVFYLFFLTPLPGFANSVYMT